MTSLPKVLTRLQADPQRTVLVLPDPTLPSARLLHTLRYYIERYGLAIEVVTETDVRTLLAAHAAVLPGRLVRLPASHFVSGAPAQVFVDRDSLIQALLAARAWVQLLPRLESWAILTDQLAFLAVLDKGVILPPAGYETWTPPSSTTLAKRPFRRTIPTMPAREAKRWH
jgi:hypothetical protein